MSAPSVFGALKESVIRRWLEVLLPVYTVAFIGVTVRPQYMPAVLNESLSDSLLPWIGWTVVGAMSGILALWGLIVAFFLAYSPAYLLARAPKLIARGWVDRRELRFYCLCFVLLCALVGLAIGWSAIGAAVIFALLAGCGPILWRCLV